MTQEQAANIFGRLTALELLVTNLMIGELVIGWRGDPRDGLAEQKRDMFGSLQLLQRAVDPETDDAWGETVSSLERIFGNAEKRFNAMLGPRG